jgi:hypothetical protein
VAPSFGRHRPTAGDELQTRKWQDQQRRDRCSSADVVLQASKSAYRARIASRPRGRFAQPAKSQPKIINAAVSISALDQLIPKTVTAVLM